MNNFTFLNKEQIKKLNYFKANDPFAIATDFSILLGCETNETIGLWWTKTFNSFANHTVVSNDKNKYYLTSKMALARNIGARPALYIEKTNQKEKNYGEYPQWIVSKEKNIQLENLYKLNILLKTEKTYTIDKNKDGSLKNFEEEKIIEYIHNNKKYIRIIGNYEWKNKTLSNGEKIKNGNPYWISVEPITWVIEQNIMFSKYILFSGIPFNIENDNSFETSEIKKYLDNNFKKEIIPSKIIAAKESKKEYLNELIKSKTKLLELTNKLKEINELSQDRTKKTLELIKLDIEINKKLNDMNNEIETLEFKNKQKTKDT